MCMNGPALKINDIKIPDEQDDQLKTVWPFIFICWWS